MLTALFLKVCVGLKGGLVQLYSQKNLVDQFQAPGEYLTLCIQKLFRQFLLVSDTVLAMTFGKLGQEEHVLVLVTNSKFCSLLSISISINSHLSDGSLLIKILKRTAEFSQNFETGNKTTAEPSNMSVAIPKKTKIFIEQTVRERENSSAIHNIFQSELWRMRLEAAKVTVDILRTGDSTFSGDFSTPLKLLAQVDGLGPDFLLTVTLENISATKVVTNLSVLLHANPEHYKIEKRYSELTPLMPGKRHCSKRAQKLY